VPWCEPCGRFYNPNTLTDDGKCPSEHQVGDPARDDTKVPWHFWLLLAALAVYLGWRVIQGVVWLVG
jgi:hypothetical protein